MKVLWVSDKVEYHQRLQQPEKTRVHCSEFIDYGKDTWLNRALHLGNNTTNTYVPLVSIICIISICWFDFFILGLSLIIRN